MTDPSSPAGRNLERRIVRLGAHEVGVTTYMVGTRWSCRVDNVDPGTVIARASGATRDDAADIALASASVTLGMRDAAEALRKSVDELRKRQGSGE
jgi:hypothetical protein